MMKKLVSLLVTVLILLIGMAPAVTVEVPLPLAWDRNIPPQGQAPAVSSFEAQGSDTSFLKAQAPNICHSHAQGSDVSSTQDQAPYVNSSQARTSGVSSDQDQAPYVNSNQVRTSGVNSSGALAFNISPHRVQAPPVRCLHYEKESFQSAISLATVYAKNTDGLKGGILPHHLLASEMIASFWKTVSLNSWDLIVLIGPDHNRKGISPITTITSAFSTVYGEVSADSGMANNLICENIAAEDLAVMEEDHAVSCHMPFIKYYMPDIPVLPLLVHGNCDPAAIGRLSDKILEYTSGKNVLFVASIDFSHYLSLEEANRMDAVTKKALINFDYEAILDMTNDNLDSRPSALFILRTMETLGTTTMVEWAHSNSDIIGNTITGNTTSYFIFGFFAF